MVRLLVLLSWVLLFVRAAGADTFTSALTSWTGSYCSDPTTCTPVGGSSSLTGSSMAFALLSSSAGASYGAVSADAYANSGSVSFGVANPAYPILTITQAVSSAQASFVDVVTLGGGSGSGYVDFLLRGGRGRIDGYSYLDFGAGGQTWTALMYGPVSTVVRMPFTFGIAFSIGATARAYAPDYDPSNPGDGSAWGIASLEVASINVFDASLNQLGAYTYETTSGSPYAFVNGTQIPEPASILLFLTVLVGIALRRYRHSGPPTGATLKG